MKYHLTAALFILTLSTEPVFAIDTPCPPGTAAISSGIYNAASCVGSSLQGLVQQTLPYKPYHYSPEDQRPSNVIFSQSERVPVEDNHSYPHFIANIAATDTFSSAKGTLNTAIPNKLQADWTFLFNGPRVIPGTRLAWMGGILWRTAQGELLFSINAAHESANHWIPMETFRNDITGFLNTAGTLTSMLFAEEYGINVAHLPGNQALASQVWDIAIHSTMPPGTAILLGFPQEGGAFASLVFGQNGLASHVMTSHGEKMTIEDFYSSPVFSSITGRGIALTD